MPQVSETVVITVPKRSYLVRYDIVSRVVRPDIVLYDSLPYQECAMFIQIISTQVPYRTAHYGTACNPDYVPSTVRGTFIIRIRIKTMKFRLCISYDIFPFVQGLKHPKRNNTHLKQM